MGRWGELLFEGDRDLDHADEISYDAGTELWNYDINEEEEDGIHGKGLEGTRDHLNNGVLHHLFVDYTTRPSGEGWSGYPEEYIHQHRNLRLIFLGKNTSSNPFKPLALLLNVY